MAHCLGDQVEHLKNHAVEDSSDSEADAGPLISGHIRRKVSISKDFISSVAIKEGFLLKQISFQRWKRRYFKLKGRKLFYAKDSKAIIFDEVDVGDISIADIRSRNVSHGFQIITPIRTLTLCAESAKEMDDWISALKNSSSKDYYEGGDHEDLLSGKHQWFATSHARPTYCNVCRDPLFGVTPHGLSCEICKYKVHKRCAAKAINNCKWTTLASIGHEIIEDQDGSLTMPHQWIEGNLPVAAKCAVCERTCGSVLRLQDWRCLWCRAMVHTSCRPLLDVKCPLGVAKVSLVPPTAIHSIGTDDSWEAIRPTGCSPLLVFVNSRSGENQGVKYLRRFKQLLNPAQVFDLIHGGPNLGLRLFRHFDPFRILICSGDGSVGWVLSEIDRLNMHKQCQVGVLPLGTGNDLARVLGWGSSCDDETHLPQLLDKYEKASTKMLDRWSVMTLERNVCNIPQTSFSNCHLMTSSLRTCEDTLLSHIAKIVQSDQNSGGVLSSTRAVCDAVQELIMRVASVCDDESLAEKCQLLNDKLERLVRVLNMEGDEKTDGLSEKDEKDMNNYLEKERIKSGKAAVLSRANSLKRAVKKLAECTEQAVERRHSTTDVKTDGLKVFSTIESTLSSEATRCASPRPAGLLLPSPLPSRHPSSGDIRLSAISPLPDVRRESATDDLLALPVPDAFADAQRRSFSMDPDSKIMIPGVTLSPPQEEGLSFWDTVVSSLNDETRSLVGSRRGSYLPNDVRKDSTCAQIFFNDEDENCNRIHLSVDTNHRPSVCSLTENAFATSGEDLGLAHIDSSESPSEEASPPNISASPPPQGCIRRSQTEGFLGSPSSSPQMMRRSPTTPNRSKIDDNLGKDRVRSIHPGHEYNYVLSEDDAFDSHQESIRKFHRRPGGLNRKDSRRLYRDSDIDFNDDLEPDELECSLARFIDDSDITRMSFRRSPKANSKNSRDSDLVKIKFKGSNGELTKEWDEKLSVEVPKSRKRLSGCLSETDDEDIEITNVAKSPTVPQFAMVVNPPSPEHSSGNRRLSVESIGKLSAVSNTAHLFASPQATRRVSNCSLLNPELIQAFAERVRTKSIDKTEEIVKSLPIINPLVRLPSWPNVSPCSGLVSKVLLANADALCATAAPLMDVDETLLEGFSERCVMNNYFGIGIDAKITLDFHQKREEHPEKCRSRTKNYMWYGVLGSREWLQKTYKNLEQRVQLECDGQRIPLPSLQGIVILNIPSFMGGTNFWGGTKEDDCFLAPSFDDRILEVVAVFGSVQMAASRLINLQHHRIAQCQTVQINILGDEEVPIQVDGEAWVQPPGVIRIIHKNRMQMLCRNRALETSLRSWEEKQRLLHNQSQQHPSHGPSRESTSIDNVSEEEIRLLLGFIEVTTTLVKCVKLLTITHPTLDRDIYELAMKTTKALDAVHPGGKILEGPALRTKLTDLVNVARELHEESCIVLRDKGYQLKLQEDMEGKLGSALTDMEIELRKCSVDDGVARLHHIFDTGKQQRSLGVGRSGGIFWLRKRRMQRQREAAASWGVTEVTQWLEAMQLGEYADSFAKNDIRGKELLALARRDLKDLGVTKVGHVKRILQAIRDLTA